MAPTQLGVGGHPSWVRLEGDLSKLGCLWRQSKAELRIHIEKSNKKRVFDIMLYSWGCDYPDESL